MVQTIETLSISFDFGTLKLNADSLARLDSLGYTVKSLQDAIHEHELPKNGDVPAVYCGTWHKYNCGSLRGMWIDLTSFSDYNDFVNFCRAIHCDETAPEIMIQDFMNCNKNFRSEFFDESDFDKVNLYWEIVERQGQEAVDDFFEFFDDIEKFDEKFVGLYENKSDFAFDWLEWTGKREEIESLCPWIDYNGIAENMFAHDFNFGSNCYVFHA